MTRRQPTSGGDDADVEVEGEQDDASSGAGSADADVVQASVDAHGDHGW